MKPIQKTQLSIAFLSAARRGSGVCPRRARQRGVALAVGLIMLIIITLLSLAAMQSVRQQERIAGNAYANSMAFSKGETALRGAEGCVNDRCDKYSPWRIVETLSGSVGSTYANNSAVSPSTTSSPFDQEYVNDWNGWGKQSYDGYYKDGIAIERLYGYMGYAPWVVVEQLPNVQSDESLEAGKKRDTEVFRSTILASNENPGTSDATVVVVLQSVLWR